MEKKHRIVRQTKRHYSKHLRLRLFMQYPYCFWCDMRVKWHTPADGILDDDAATLDHLESLHKIGPEEPVDVVLACYRCNNVRNREEQMEIPWEEKVRRTGSISKVIRGTS